MEEYPYITKLISNINIDDYSAYKKCVKGIAEITAFDVYNIPYLWNEMLTAVLKSCNIKVEYDTKQTISNWIDAAFMWDAEVYAVPAKNGRYPFPVCGDYYDFGFSRELGYLSHVDNPYLRSYIKAIALFENLRYYINEEMPKPKQDAYGLLLKKEWCFDEKSMWEIVIGNWHVDIDWNFYDVQFDGHNFLFDTHNQKLKLDRILNEKRYKNIDADGMRYRLPAQEFIVGAVPDDNGMIYSVDGRILLCCPNKDVVDYKIKDGTCIICSKLFSDGSQLESLEIPESVVFIDNWAFRACESLGTVKIEGNGLEVIGACAFFGLRSLTQINIPDSVTGIDEGAFGECSIKEFFFGKNIVSLTGGYGNECTPMYEFGYEAREFDVHPENRMFCSIEGLLYSKDKKTLYACPEGKIMDSAIDTIFVPEGTEELYYHSFVGIDGLKKLVLPSTIRIIGDWAVSGNVEELVLMSKQPPKIVDTLDKDIVVRVPNDSVELYRNDENWSKVECKCIIGIDEPVPHKPSQEELKALLLWKMGIGNMGKYFNGENAMPKKEVIATADSWDIQPMPDKNAVIETNITIPNEAMDLVLKGHIPEAMEDHWFMYCDDNTIRYYRSWTGICVYVANYKKESYRYRITSLTVNRNQQQSSQNSDRKDYCLFMYLLISDAGGDGSSFFDEYVSYINK